jgi:CspA family cold shock protein
MANGKIKWFNMKKGYGFIEPENGEKDVFIHISALEKAGIKFLSDNQKVSYEVNQTKGKLSAGNIKLLD